MLDRAGDHTDNVGGTKTKRWQLQLSLGSDPTAAKTYQLTNAGTLAATGAMLQYEDETATGARSWAATGGSIIVDSRSGNTATLMFDQVPTSAVVSDGNTATGSFTVSGEVTVDDVAKAIEF